MLALVEGWSGGDGVRAAGPQRAASTCMRKELSGCDLLGHQCKSRGCGAGTLSLFLPLFFLQSWDENGWHLVTLKFFSKKDELKTPGAQKQASLVVALSWVFVTPAQPGQVPAVPEEWRL